MLRRSSRAPQPWRKPRSLVALGAAAIAAVIVATAALWVSSPGTAAEPLTLPSSVKLTQWHTIPAGDWTAGALQKNNSDYMEGEVVPFQLEIPSQVGAGQYRFEICREYQPGTADPVRGYIYLDVFNHDRPAVPDGGAPTNALGPLRAINATLDTVVEMGANGGHCDIHEHRTVVTFSKGAGTAYVLWGGHLAAPSDLGVGMGNGASQFPGGSLHMRLGTPDKSVGIQPDAIIPQPTLTVIKHVVNDDGGTAVAGDFTMQVTAHAPTLSSFPGSESGTTIALLPGAYEVTENGPAGYAMTATDGCAGTIAAGESRTCTITNNDIPPAAGALKVVKTERGIANAPDWNIRLSGGPTARPDQTITGSSFTTFTGLTAGSYTITETNGTNATCSTTSPPGSFETLVGTSADEALATPGTTLTAIQVRSGETTTVFVFNRACVPPATSELIIQKFNDPLGNRTGTAAIGGFQFAVTKDGSPLPGSPFTSPANGDAIVLTGLGGGSYVITEATPAGWQLTGSKADIDADGEFEIDVAGQPPAIVLSADGDSDRVHFYNRALGSLLVEKWTLRNGANELSQNAGWHITISSVACNFTATADTVAGDPAGTVLFAGIPACPDYRVSEDTNSKSGAIPPFSPVDPAVRENVAVEPGVEANVHFVNGRTDPSTPTPTATATATTTAVPSLTPTATPTLPQPSTTTPVVPTATPVSPTAVPPTQVPATLVPPTATPTEAGAVSPSQPTPRPPVTGGGSSDGNSVAGNAVAIILLSLGLGGLASASVAMRRARR